MKIHSRVNQYNGINAHLQSYFQAVSGWHGFHNLHIGHIAQAIQDVLPDGYIVDSEQSLQIVEDDNVERQTGTPYPKRPQPDVTIYADQPQPARPAPHDDRTAAPVLELPLVETLTTSEERILLAVVIYRSSEESVFGDLVTRIELLSPTNKVKERIYYQQNRLQALRSGVNLVEMDYMHETPSPILGIPRYPHADHSYPFTIAISTPQPTLTDGRTRVYGFRVDEALSLIPIPLLGDDVAATELGGAYDMTFRTLIAYGRRVDYAVEPHRMERYSAADQARIRRRMAAVQRAHAAGVDLDAHAPLPLPDEEA